MVLERIRKHEENNPQSCFRGTTSPLKLCPSVTLNPEIASDLAWYPEQESWPFQDTARESMRLFLGEFVKQSTRAAHDVVASVHMEDFASDSIAVIA